MNRIEIGKKIKELRTDRKLSQRQLADLVGITYASIANIELGKYSVGIDILCHILDKLNAHIEIIES